MNQIYIKFYEQQTRHIHKDDMPKDFPLKEDAFIMFDQDEIKLRPDILIGRLDHKKTFGFLRQEVKDQYIEGTHLSDAMHDDIVFVKDDISPKVVHIIKRALKHVVVTVKKKQADIEFLSDTYIDRKLNVSVEGNIVDGHVLLLEVTKIEKDVINAKLEKIVGHINDPDINTLKIVAQYQWPQTFRQDVLDETNAIQMDFNKEKNERIDLTDALIVTIDGADAKDLDDAISLEIIDDHYHLGVHIADVSHYVKKDTLLDLSAYERSTSAYLADRVIPMLPHVLSNDWCSLNPHEPKLTLSCQMVLDQDAKVVSYDIQKTIIHSKHRLTYKKVNDFLNDGKTLHDDALEHMLISMNELAQKLKKVRTKRGEIEFETSELGFVVDDKGRVLDVYERTTDQAEKLIESLMLIANETVAFHMYHAKLPTIYRIHEKPDNDKLRMALETIKQLGFPVNFKQLGQPKPLQFITKNTVNSPYGPIVHGLLLRAMQKAKYSATLDIHYGLGARYYTHFTSPIRRYPDLILHRLIHLFVLGESKNYQEDIKHFEHIMYEVGQHTSDQERKAVQMERDVAKLKSCEYMADKIGDIFKANITQMMPSGMFVKLHNGIEGFVALSSMDDYYRYDVSMLSYIGHKGLRYRLGDEITVECIAVDIDDKKMDFKIIPKKRVKKGKHHENHKSKQKSKA
ncbi:MAG: ribonuclease R [Acholeplasmataceae bacterium]